MDTSCAECVFATWDGDTQSGCKFKRLEKFKERGADIALIDDKYYLIKDRICNTCRHPKTLEKILPRKWKHHVRREIIPRVAMLVYVDDDSQFDSAIETMKSFLNQTMPPYEIILLYNVNQKTASTEYLFWLQDNVKNIPWCIENIKIENCTYEKSVDIALKSKNVKSIYFTSCKAGYTYDKDYIETLDYAINDELLRFVAILPDVDGNALFVQRSIHNFINGSEGQSIISKLQEISDEENTQHMIKPYEELLACRKT